MAFSLVRCSADGTPVEAIAVCPREIVASYGATADLYRRVRYVEPWVGYVAVVEIAYFTLQEHNASTRILQRLGFAFFGNARDPDAGNVWEWRA